LLRLGRTFDGTSQLALSNVQRVCLGGRILKRLKEKEKYEVQRAKEISKSSLFDKRSGMSFFCFLKKGNKVLD